MVAKPELTVNYGIFDFFFEEEQVAVRVDHLRQQRDSLTGEISIMQKSPGQKDLLHQAKLNLQSTQSRKTLSKYLQSRVDTLDWDMVLEWVCLLTITTFREGDPIIDVGITVPQFQTSYHLHPLLLDGECNLIYGPGGAGKSYIACLISALAQHGVNHCGLIAQKGNVLYLDYETSSAEINRRLYLVQRGLSLPLIPTTYRLCHQPLADEIELIHRIVVDKNIKLIIVDSVGAACGGEPESAAIVMRYFMALRSLKLTTLSIDHVAKATTQTPFGSVYKINATRSVWEMRSAQTTGDSFLEIGLYHRKTNAGKLHKAIGLRINFYEDGVIFEPSEVGANPTLSAGLSIRDQITELLKHGPMAMEEIASQINEDKDSVRRTLGRYKKGERSGRFIKLDEKGNKWGLLSKLEE